MRRDVGRFPDRVWAIEGCSGIGRHIAHRLLAAGEEIIDVPPKLSAEVGFRDRAGPQDQRHRRAFHRPTAPEWPGYVQW